jgi:hypothetical protein
MPGGSWSPPQPLLPQMPSGGGHAPLIRDGSRVQSPLPRPGLPPNKSNSLASPNHSVVMMRGLCFTIRLGAMLVVAVGALAALVKLT